MRPDQDILVALDRVTIQRIAGLMVLVDELEQRILEHNGQDDPLYKNIPLLRDKLTKIQESISSGTTRDEEWADARAVIDILCQLAKGEVQVH